jgi:DNA-3-methyladenine glycosylase II
MQCNPMNNNYINHLAKDHIFKEILKDAAPRELKKTENLTLFLYSSIINQQLSTKVGAVILSRFLDLFGGSAPASQQVIDIPFDELKSIGLSRSKTQYIKNVAEFDATVGLDFDTLNALSDDEVIKELTSIKGIGKWSAQNFLIAALGREDVFSGDDLIIQNVMAQLYNLDKADKKNFKLELERISKDWSPYRTYASLHIWQWNNANKG